MPHKRRPFPTSKTFAALTPALLPAGDAFAQCNSWEAGTQMPAPKALGGGVAFSGQFCVVDGQVPGGPGGPLRELLRGRR